MVYRRSLTRTDKDFLMKIRTNREEVGAHRDPIRKQKRQRKLIGCSSQEPASDFSEHLSPETIAALESRRTTQGAITTCLEAEFENEEDGLDE
jgi:hypothetical protein